MPVLPDIADIPRHGEEAIRSARHREAIAALATSPMPGLLETVEAIRKSLLAANPQALRRSVGWFGRLLGRDIALQAESNSLRSQLGVHVVAIRRQLADTTRHREQLAQARQALLDAAGVLSRDAAGLADSLATAAPDLAAAIAPRMRHLAALADGYQITASHLELTLLNHDDLLRRIELMLPRVELLLDQDRMLRDDRAGRAALQSANAALEAVHALPLNRITEHPQATDPIANSPRSTP